MTDYQMMGKKLKQLRKEEMLTLEQLSEKAGISAGYISKIERGTVNPSAKNIQKICFVLGITANELMIDKEESEKLTNENKNKSYILKKEERLPIYGMTDVLSFESLYEENPHFKMNVMTISGNMKGEHYSVHSYDEFGVVAKGKLELILEDTDSYVLEEGECIMIRANTKHAITNSFDDESISYWIEIGEF
ncbi:hypothetical protein IGI39_004674 [Enterococcus sp. AZ135]